MNDTGIAWTNVTWNPVTGCEEVTEGCKFCYAKVIAEKQSGGRAFPNGFGMTLRPHKLRDPFKLKTPSLVFVNSMSDFFWDEIPDEYRDRCLDTIEQTPQHQYQVLTKRPATMLRYSQRRRLPPNFWAGVTIENQRTAVERLAILKQVDAEIRFLSLEPLLGPIDVDLTGIHWVITGGESGLQISSTVIGKNRALVERPAGRWVPKAEALVWLRGIRDSCIAQDVRHFFKQWGGPYPISGGRTLDGRTWDEFPRMPEGGAVNRRLHDKQHSVWPA